MELKTLDDFDFRGKRVLVRPDLNSGVKNGRVILGDRIIESAKTIKELKKKSGRVVVLAHQGFPGKKDFISLRQHARLLNKFVKIKFIDDVVGRRAVREIINLRSGEALMLENVRSLKDEFAPSVKNDLVRVLVPLFNVYINDAFSVCHREQSSIVSFPVLMEKGIGRLMEKELDALEKLKLKDCLYVLGGAKTEDKKLLIKKGNKVLLTGLLAFIYRNKKLPRECIAPVDYVDGKDIGLETIELYKREIAMAKCILMVGPAGVYEDKKFARGTRELLKAIANSKAFSVIGGGHTVAALKMFKISKNNFSYVSLAGGALVRYLAGEKLPGIEALKRRNNE